MTAIYQEVELQWRGKTWTVTPTYRLIQQIEQDVSIAGVGARIAKGEPPLSHVAHIVAMLLRAAGCRDVTGAEVYAVLMSDMPEEQLIGFAEVVLSAFVPQDPDEAAGDDNPTPPAPPADKAAEKATSSPT